MSSFTVNLDGAESQDMIERTKENPKCGCLMKLTIGSCVISLLSCGLVITFIITTWKSAHVTDVAFPSRYAHFVLRENDGETSGLIVKNWEMAGRLGREDILSKEDKNGKFTVQAPGFYDIKARVTFRTTAPFDKCVLYLNGEVLDDQVVSSHRQVGTKPEKSDVVCYIFRSHNLEKGNTISFGVISGRQETVVSRYTSFEIKQS